MKRISKMFSLTFRSLSRVPGVQYLPTTRYCIMKRVSSNNSVPVVVYHVRTLCQMEF